MAEELRPCIVEIGEQVEERKFIHGKREVEIIKRAETHKGHFHIWGSEAYVTNGYLVGTTAGQVSSFYGVVEYEDGTVHKVAPECITFTDMHNETVNKESEKDMIVEGDVCEFGKNEKVYVCVTLGRGSMTDGRCVEGFYLTGGNVGHIGRFNLKELRKTDKHINIENFLNQR